MGTHFRQKDSGAVGGKVAAGWDLGAEEEM